MRDTSKTICPIGFAKKTSCLVWLLLTTQQREIPCTYMYRNHTSVTFESDFSSADFATSLILEIETSGQHSNVEARGRRYDRGDDNEQDGKSEARSFERKTTTGHHVSNQGFPMSQKDLTHDSFIGSRDAGKTKVDPPCSTEISVLNKIIQFICTATECQPDAIRWNWSRNDVKSAEWRVNRKTVTYVEFPHFEGSPDMTPCPQWLRNIAGELKDYRDRYVA